MAPAFCPNCLISLVDTILLSSIPHSSQHRCRHQTTKTDNKDTAKNKTDNKDTAKKKRDNKDTTNNKTDNKDTANKDTDNKDTANKAITRTTSARHQSQRHRPRLSTPRRRRRKQCQRLCRRVYAQLKTRGWQPMKTQTLL